jgi:hypothetical protein
MKAALIVFLALMVAGCKAGSSFGVSAGFGGAEVGYKYNAPRKPRAKKAEPTPTPTPTPTARPVNPTSF